LVLLIYSLYISNLIIRKSRVISCKRIVPEGIGEKLAVLDTSQKVLAREKQLIKERSKTFCTDCILDWCKMRNKVVYCSQKYKGENCYSCSDDKCQVKRIAGA